jgi:glycerol-1-phosphatase
MIMLTPEEAFRAYEAVRHRLPSAVPSTTPPEHVASLAALADRFDVFLLDAFGVLNIGDAAIPETPDRVAALQAAGKRVLVVSNAASMAQDKLLRKYQGLGYDFALEDVITSRGAMGVALKGHDALKWGVMSGTPSDLADLGTLTTIPLGDDPQPYALAEGFLLIGSATWTQTRQAMLEGALRAAPRPILVANPDIVAPRENGFTAEPGYFAHQLADRTGVTPRFFGKPFEGIYDLVFKKIGEVDRSRVLMVGDSLHTDVLGAQTAGIRSALVANFGFFAGQDVTRAIAMAGIVPDFVLDRP